MPSIVVKKICQPSLTYSDYEFQKELRSFESEGYTLVGFSSYNSHEGWVVFMVVLRYPENSTCKDCGQSTVDSFECSDCLKARFDKEMEFNRFMLERLKR